MTALSDVLSVLMRDARRIAVSADAEVSTTTRAGVISVRVTDGGVTLLSATLDTRPRADAPRAEQLPLPGVSTGQRAAPLMVPAQRAEAVAPQDDDGPAPINGVCVGDRLTLDDEPIEVMGVDHEGFTWRTVATDAKGRSDDEGDVLWREVVEGRPGHWRVTEVEAKASREKALWAKADASSKPKRTAKPKPARLTAVPEADRLVLHGHQVIAWQQTEGAPWEALLDRVSGTAKALRETWASAAQGFRAREYSRGGKCVRDSLDEARS